MEGKSSLKVSGLVKRFDGKTVLDNVSLEVREGELFGLLGPNGAGKTTMIRVILNILRPDAGEVLVLGREFSEEVKKSIGYLPEEGGLYRKTKVFDCIKYFAELKGVDKADAGIDEWLRKLNLYDYRNKNISELSKGMSRKVQFIIAILHKPSILILDEPFYGLDPVNKMHIEGIIHELKKGGMTIIMSTHQMDEVEKMCDRILLINKGKPVLYGDLAGIKGRYGFSVDLEYSGTLPKLDGVVRVNDHGNQAELILEKGADTKKMLRILADEVEVRKFEIKTRSLNDIFIEEVGK